MTSRTRDHRIARALGGAACVLASACQGVSSAPAEPPTGRWHPSDAESSTASANREPNVNSTRSPDVPVAREALTFGFAVLDRHQDPADPVDDAFAWSLWYTRDLWPGVLRPAVELGAGYSEHGVDGFEASKLDVYRLCAGGKLTLEPEGLPLSVWARAGWFYRFTWDFEFQDEPYDQDGGGHYAGCGIDLRVGDGVRAGPFVDYFRGTSVDALEETSYGIGVTWSL